MSTATAPSDETHHRFERLLGPYQVLRGNRDLTFLFSGQAVSSIGDWLYITVLVVMAYMLTGSAMIAGALTFTRLLPYALFLPLSGVLADRFDRKRLMIGADLGRAACMIGLLFVTSRSTVWLAFPLVFISTCLFSLFRPALGATVPAAAHGNDNLVQANALMSQVDGLAILIGPALAGLLLLGGVGRLAFAINAATYIASTLTLLQLRIVAPAREREDQESSVHWLAETLAGWRFLRRQGRGALMAVTVTTTGGSCFNGAIATLAIVLSEQTWHFGSQGAGFLTGCAGAGALLASFIVGAYTGRFRMGQGYILAMVGTIALIALFGISPTGPLPFIALACFGVFDGLNAVMGNTIIQQTTPDELLGRVFGIFEAIVITGLLAGALAVGILIDAIGPRATTVSFALVPLALLVTYLPGLRRLDAPAAESMAEIAVGASADLA